MKKTLLSSLVLSTGLLCSNNVIADDMSDINPVKGVYTGATVGFLYFSDISGFNLPAIPGLPAVNSPKLMHKLGVTAAFQLGYRATKHFRMEGEFLYSNAKARRVVLGTTKVPNAVFGLNGMTSSFAGMFNLYYDMFFHHQHSANDISPYVGIGVGMARVATKLKFYQNGVFLQRTNNGRNSVGVAQGIIGLNYYLDDFTSLGIDYRYRQTKKLKTFNRALRSNNINFTMNFALDDFYGTLGSNEPTS